jgi:hypothetical protein
VNDTAQETALGREPSLLDFDPAVLSPARGLERVLRGRLLAQLRELRDCQLRLVDADGDLVLGRAAIDPADTLHATIRVRDPGFYRQVASNGSVGAGEAYMDGLWDCNDLVSLVRILVRNRDRLDAMETGFARLGGFAMRLLHALQRNTRGGSRRNIAAHYDLGNELLRAVPRPESLMYSRRSSSSPNESLEVGAAPQAGAHLHASWNSRSRATGDRNRHRLGRFRPARRARATDVASPPPRSRSEQYERAATTGAARAGLGRSHHPAAATRLPRPRWPLRQAGFDRDDRSHRPSVPRHLFRPGVNRCSESHGMPR